MLWICHMDIVEAKAEDWTLPPFKFTEKDGYFYGRGTSDMKDQDAAVAAPLIRLKKEGFVPDRDIIVAFTADEEVGLDQDGLAYLLREHQDLVDAGLAINPDGDSRRDRSTASVSISASRPARRPTSPTRWTVTNKGGHSSEPRPDNAIYHSGEWAGAAFTNSSSRSRPMRRRGFISNAWRRFETGSAAPIMLAMAK